MRFDPVRIKLQRLKPFIGRKADLIWGRYQAGDRLERAEWEQTVNLLAQRHRLDTVEDRIALPPPKVEDARGEILIGALDYFNALHHPFGLRLPELTRHTGIFGSTGSGKTSLAKNILRQFIGRRIPFIVFDWERNYRDLLLEFDNLKVFTIGAKASPFHFNFLDVPPGISKDEYMKSVVDVFSRAYVGGAGADSVLLKVLDKAYAEQRLPTVKDLREVMQGEMKGFLKGREMLWKQSTMRMFDFLAHGGTGRLLDTVANHAPSRLFNDFIVFELGGLSSPYDRRFFIEMFTLWYWLHKEHEGVEHESLKHVLVYEEFHNIVQNSQKEDLIQKVFRQIRKYGVGLVVLDQTPSLIPNPIFENLFTKIAFSLSHRSNVQAVADAMFMDPEERNFLGLLKVGQAICRLAGRCSEPFLVDVPFIPARGEMSDTDVLRHMERFSEYSRPESLPQEESGGIRAVPRHETLSPLARILLEDIAKSPFEGVAKRYKKLGFSAARGTSVQKELVQKDMVSPVTIEGYKFLEPTAKGKAMLERFGTPWSPGSGRGGLEHAFHVHRIMHRLVETGGFAFIEQDDIDVVAYRIKLDGEQTLAVQVETGKSNIKKNIQTLLAHKADGRFMVATNKMAEAKINSAMESLGKQAGERIQVLSSRAFLKNAPFDSYSTHHKAAGP